MGNGCSGPGQIGEDGALAGELGADAAASSVGEVETFNNIILLSDSYKVTHHLQYPPNTETIYSYFECRGGLFEEVCFFGLQYILKRYLVGQVVTRKKIVEAETYFRQHFSQPNYGYNEQLFNRKGWEYILSEHDGRLPLSIRAVPEGTVLPWKNVLFTVVNTDPKCFWLTNYVESILVEVWYPTTVCTQSREMKKIISKYLRETGSEEVVKGGGVLFKLHDFGFRGVSSVESAAVGSVAHWVNFLGSDTLAGLVLAREFYGEPGAGVSFPASEHSTITSWGREQELDAYRNMLQQFPRGTMSCCSDSYDIFKACEEFWGTDLKRLVEMREGTLLVRPDSGKLPGIVLQVLDKLESKFGSVETGTGHKKLPDYIRVMQGDGIDINSVDLILRTMKNNGWAADNVAFSSGGSLLQRLHRDTQRCAFKCSFAKVAGEGVDVTKDPVTDPGKRSKKGKLTLEFRNGKYVTVTEGLGEQENDVMKEVFRDGRLLIDETLNSVRQRSEGESVKTEPLEFPLQTSVTSPDRNLGSLFNNILMLSDSYKVTHHLQYPEGTETVYSYFESRGGAYQELCFFGLQYYLKRYLAGPQVVTREKIDQAEEHFRRHFSHPTYGFDEKLFNREGWEYILNTHGGQLPVVIKAVPEGTVLPCQNVLFTVENTDPQCFWLTNYLETLLVQVWYPTTVCTQSREQKKTIARYLRETGGEEAASGARGSGSLFNKLHDFGFRGVSSAESAAIGGAAHLVNFMGTDTLPALVMLKSYYSSECAGTSVPASEHSTITAWGKDRELDACRNMLEKFPTGLVACVSDSYDIFNACEQLWGTDLKDSVTQRNGMLIIRPDSGELPQTLLQVLEKLETKFGSTKTSTGHRLLPSCVRIIQGDGIDARSIEKILSALRDSGWAIDNLSFGSGGALLQKVHRDVLNFAFKCSSVMVKGEPRDVCKDPITDPAKKSKRGRLTLERQGEATWVTTTEGLGNSDKDELREVFRDGKVVLSYTLEDIRRRAAL